MNHIQQIIFRLLASCIFAVLTACGGKDEKTVQASPEKSLEAFKGAEIASVVKNSSEGLTKPSDVSAVHVDPTAVDQGVVNEAAQISPVSAEKKALSEKISLIDHELLLVEEQLQGALFEVRQKDPECGALTTLLREKNGQVALALEKHPARGEAQQNVQTSSLQLAAARDHFEETLKTPAPAHGNRGLEGSLICQLCADHDAYEGNDRISHRQAAAKWLSDAQKANISAIRNLQVTMENVQKSDPEISRVIADRNAVQMQLDARFASNPLTADMLGKRQQLLTEKKDATANWVKIIMAKSIPSPKTGNSPSKINTDS